MKWLLSFVVALLLFFSVSAGASVRPLQSGDKLPESVAKQIPAQWQSNGFVMVIYDMATAPWHPGKSVRSMIWDKGYYPTAVLLRYDTNDQYEAARKRIEQVRDLDANHLCFVYAKNEELKYNSYMPQKLFVRHGTVQLIGLERIPHSPLPQVSGQLTLEAQPPEKVSWMLYPVTDNGRNKGLAKATGEPIAVKIIVRGINIPRNAPLVTCQIQAIADTNGGMANEVIPVGRRFTFLGGKNVLTVIIPAGTVHLGVDLTYQIGDVRLHDYTEVNLWPKPTKK
jgi:hypothetical protein